MSGISSNLSPLIKGSVQVVDLQIEGEEGSGNLIQASTGEFFMLTAITVQCDGGTPTYRVSLLDSSTAFTLVLATGTVTTSEVLIDLSKLNAPIYSDSRTNLVVNIEGGSEGVVNTFRCCYVRMEAS